MRSSTGIIVGATSIILVFFVFLVFYSHMPIVRVEINPEESVVPPDPSLTEVIDPTDASTVHASSVDWDSYFPKICDDSPDDYPQKKIGACPYSKPQSSSLPFQDMPMCMYTKP